MIVPKLLLKRQKKALVYMSTIEIEERLNNLKAQLEQIQTYKKLYQDCYIDEQKNLYFTNPLKQKIQLIERELDSRVCENEIESSL